MPPVQFSRAVADVSVTFVTHEHPHLDEIMAAWLIQRFATAAWLNQRRTTSSVTIELGIGDGEFNEHPRNGEPRKRDDCCATLVARSLGVHHNPPLKAMIHFVYTMDQLGGGAWHRQLDPEVQHAGHGFDLYNLVKLLNFQYPDDPERVREITYQLLDAKYSEQLEIAAAEEVLCSAHSVVFDTAVGEMRLVAAHSDNRHLARAAFSNSKDRLDLLLQTKPNGQVFIFCRRKRIMSLSQVVRLLRIAEARLRKPFVEPPESELRNEGFAAGDEKWYYSRTGEMILNGSITKREVQPTRLTTPVIEDCVRLGVQRFHNKRSQRSAETKA